MSDKAETVTCVECGGKGEVLGPLDHALVETCGVCSGTGVRTTGEVVGMLPSTPAACETCGGTGDWILPNGDNEPCHRCGGTGLEPLLTKNNVEPWTPAAAIERANATIAAQAAEIERLKRELCTAEKEILHMRESNGRADDYSAKLERVIEALRYELAAAVHCQAATIRSIVRLANAGLELPQEADNE